MRLGDHVVYSLSRGPTSGRTSSRWRNTPGSTASGGGDGLDDAWSPRLPSAMSCFASTAPFISTISPAVTIPGAPRPASCPCRRRSPSSSGSPVGERCGRASRPSSWAGRAPRRRVPSRVRGRAEGFCYLNDLAVAARTVQPRVRPSGDGGRSGRPPGNGTAAIFRGDPTVYTFSIHKEDNYRSRSGAIAI